jgi:hypothetical protein
VVRAALRILRWANEVFISSKTYMFELMKRCMDARWWLKCRMDEARNGCLPGSTKKRQVLLRTSMLRWSLGYLDLMM